MMTTSHISPVHGWLIIDKPLHMTSAHVVSLVKKKLGGIKTGHAGTLDPLATGVLPLALGEATKTVQYVMTGRKQYRFEVTWGEARTTDDREGQIMTTSGKRPSKEEILAVLGNFQGKILQTPPCCSALKINGRRACDLMRQQKPVQPAPRFVEIFSLQLQDVISPDCAIFEIECGKGTYVRSVARDMGQTLGCYGYASAIDRISVSQFQKKQAISLEKLASLDENVILREYVKEIPDVLDDIPAVPISEAQAMRLRLGQGITADALPDVNNEKRPVLLCLDLSGKPVAFVRHHENKLWPERVFNI